MGPKLLDLAYNKDTYGEKLFFKNSLCTWTVFICL